MNLTIANKSYCKQEKLRKKLNHKNTQYMKALILGRIVVPLSFHKPQKNT